MTERWMTEKWGLSGLMEISVQQKLLMANGKRTGLSFLTSLRQRSVRLFSDLAISPFNDFNLPQLPVAGMRQDELAFGAGAFFGDAHHVERAIDEDQGHQEEDRADDRFSGRTLHGDGDFHGQETEEGGEFDHRV